MKILNNKKKITFGLCFFFFMAVNAQSMEGKLKGTFVLINIHKQYSPDNFDQDSLLIFIDSMNSKKIIDSITYYFLFNVPEFYNFLSKSPKVYFDFLSMTNFLNDKKLTKYKPNTNLSNLIKRLYGKRTISKREENNSGVFITTQIKILELAIDYIIINAKPSIIGSYKLELIDNMYLQLNPNEKEEKIFLPIIVN